LLFGRIFGKDYNMMNIFSLRSIAGLSGIEQGSEVAQSRFGTDIIGRWSRKSRPQLPHGHIPSIGLGQTGGQDEVVGQHRRLDWRRWSVLRVERKVS